MSTGTAGPEHKRPFKEVVLICVFSIVGIMLTAAAAIWFGLEFYSSIS
jgi:hypothetical protein